MELFLDMPCTAKTSIGPFMQHKLAYTHLHRHVCIQVHFHVHAFHMFMNCSKVVQAKLP